jgi:two-component system cell cycle response regulator
MTLQRRLTLFFVLIVILPLAAAGFVVRRVVVGEISRRAVISLAPALDATVALYNDRVDAIDDRVRASVQVPRFAELMDNRNVAGTRAFLDERLSGTDNLDFIIAFDKRGDVLTSSSNQGDFVPGFDTPSIQEVVKSPEQIGMGFARIDQTPVMVPGRGVVGSVVGGFWIDQSLLLASSQESVVLSLAAGDRIIASTTELSQRQSVDVSFTESFDTDVGETSKARARPLAGDMSIVASTPIGPIESLSQRVLTSMLGLLALAIIGTTLLAYLLARLITQPLEELAKGAQAIGEGRFDTRIHLRSRDEVGQLAQVFNDMSERLSNTISALSSSRDQLQRAVRRVGETLRSTHDMGQLLVSTLNTAVDAVEADAGVMWRFTPNRSELYPATYAGLDEGIVGRVQVGKGIAGHVAERAANVLVPSGSGGPRASNTEPDAPVLMAIPMYSRDRVVGVLALYRNDPKRTFKEQDLETVVFLAEQGGVAIENVQLHEEAKRLSLMDGLTGTWNRRFFQMQFRQVLATSTRFERPFSILMLDLDHFKEINDTFGHQRGDAILIEFAERVSGTLREVDTFARYGGEEFICLLSETDVNGARTTAEKICDVIRADPFGVSGEEPIPLTVSVGVASYPEDGSGFRSLVESADKALYVAKKKGRDRVAVAGDADPQLKLAT